MLLRVSLLFVALLGASSASEQREVSVLNGTIIGSLVTAGSKTAWQFLGIPFAEKPLGPLRFAKPRPLQQGWSEPLQATTAPNRCPQAPNGLLIDKKVDKKLVAPFDEDCLFLNIWTPLKMDSPKAVMVWFHGGSYVGGEGLPMYHGAALAALHDVVLVTAQYRLGALGFLRLSDRVGGNWGLFDQQLALRWVRDNILAFGGDPSRVTIFGESAGASSVTLQLFNPDSAACFHRVIAQSGSALSSWAFSPNASLIAEDHVRFAKAVGCEQSSEEDLLACLRATPTEKMVAEQGNMQLYRWLPVVDGDFLREDPRVARPPEKEVMLGVIEDEAGMITDIVMKMVPDTPPEHILPSIFADFPFYPERMTPLATAAMAPLLTSHARPQDLEQKMRRVNRAYTDFSFVCPTNEFADRLHQQGLKTFMFLLTHRSSFSPYPSYVGATHGDDVAFVFRLDVIYPHVMPMNPAEQELAHRMAEELTAFAKTGRPASNAWSQFSAANKEFFEFAIPSSPRVGGIHRDDCSFWTKVLPQLHAAGKAQEEKKDSKDISVLLVALGIVLLVLLKK